MKQVFPGWPAYCRVYGLPPPQTELQFDPQRRFRFDASWFEYRVAVEVQGGIRRGFASHSSYDQRRRDMEKINRAQMLGWVVLQFEWKDVMSGAAVEVIRGAISARGGDFRTPPDPPATTPETEKSPSPSRRRGVEKARVLRKTTLS